MGYTALCHFLEENNISYEITYETRGFDATVGTSFFIAFEDFEYNNKTYYPKFAINNGEVYFRNSDNGIECNSMVISTDLAYSQWIVVCSDNAESTQGEQNISIEDFVDEIYLTDKNLLYSSNRSDDVISIDVTQGAISDGFASYGSSYSPRLSFTMFKNDFTDALTSGAFHNDVLNANLIHVWYTITGHPYIPLFLGRFIQDERPTISDETISVSAVGLMEAYMSIAEIDIESLNLYHKQEIEDKYVKSGYMEFATYTSDKYFWEFLPEDFLRVTGSPLFIDGWEEIKGMMQEYHTEQLFIPTLESYTETDENVYTSEYTSRITWRELLSGVAILLRGNVIEKNGAFYIKRLPDDVVDNETYYRQVFNNSNYGSEATFGNELFCPSEIAITSNNWYFYENPSTKEMVAFGYYEDQSTVVLNNKKSEYSNVSHYNVNIECPWVLFETMNRVPNNYKDFSIKKWLGHNNTLRWKDMLDTRNNVFLYNQASLSFNGWVPTITPGNIIIVEDFDGIKRYIYVGEMTLHYDGSVYVDITSPADIQSQNQSSVGGGSTGYSSNAVASSNGANMGVMFGVSIKNASITGSKIADSTIENSHIVDGTLDGKTKIKDASIDFAKIDDAFISDLTTDSLFAKNLTSAVANIESLTADDAIIKNIFSENIITDKAIIDVLQSNIIDADVIRSATAEFGYITSDDADLKYVTSEYIKALELQVDALDTDVADINTLIFGSAAGTTIQTSFANAIVAQIGNAQIKSAMIKDIAASKITSGDINTNNIRVVSEDGSLVIEDETIQISDDNRVRVQIGKDADNDYSINIWDADGNLMFSEGGITDKAIKNAIIRDDMLSSNANISAGKLNIPSLFKEINDSEETIKSTRIYLDEQEQTLDVTFKEMSDELSSQGTSLEVVQGSISSKVWQQDINKAIDDIEVGGRNYILFGSGKEKKGFFANFTLTDSDGYCMQRLVSKKQYKSVSLKPGYLIQPREYPVGAKVTFSYDIMYTEWNFPEGSDRKALWIGQKYSGQSISGGDATGAYRDVTTSSLPVVGVGGCELNKWFHVEKTFTIPEPAAEGITDVAVVEFYNSNPDVEASITFKLRNVKLEYGNKATDWTPAPEDTESDISELTTKYSSLEQNLDGFKTEVGRDYATKTGLESVRTIAEQTANKFSWLVKSGTSSSDFTLTDRMAKLTAEIISLNGDVKVNGDMLVDGSITAEKLDVDDLSALGAKIGGWEIDESTITSNLITEISPDGSNIFSGHFYLDVDKGIVSKGNLNNSQIEYSFSGGLWQAKVSDTNYMTIEMYPNSIVVNKRNGNWGNEMAILSQQGTYLNGILTINGKNGEIPVNDFAETIGYATTVSIAGVSFSENSMMYGHSVNTDGNIIKHFGGALQINTTSALSDEWRTICKLPQEARPSEVVRTFASIYVTNTSRFATQYAINILTNGDVMMLGSVTASSSYRILIPTVYYI